MKITIDFNITVRADYDVPDNDHLVEILTGLKQSAYNIQQEDITSLINRYGGQLTKESYAQGSMSKVLMPTEPKYGDA